MPVVNERIRYRTEDNDEWTYAQINGKGGKSTGKNKFYFNVTDETEGTQKGVHLDRVHFEIMDKPDDKSDEDVNITTIPTSEHWKTEVVQAKEREIDNWKTFKVFTEVPDNGQKTISTKWVITKKNTEYGSKTMDRDL